MDKKTIQAICVLVMGVVLAIAGAALSGCAGSGTAPGGAKLDQLFDKETNYVATVVQVTNAATGEVTQETNIVEVVKLGATSAKTEGVIRTTGGIAGLYSPWAGFGTAAALGLLGVYRGWRNRNVKEALVQGIETGRELLTSADPALRDKYTQWLQKHQRELGVLNEVGKLVDLLSDNDAAKGVAAVLTQQK